MNYTTLIVYIFPNFLHILKYIYNYEVIIFIKYNYNTRTLFVNSTTSGNC